MKIVYFSIPDAPPKRICVTPGCTCKPLNNEIHCHKTNCKIVAKFLTKN